MRPTIRISVYLILSVLILLVGCTDSMLSSQAEFESADRSIKAYSQVDAPLMRHAHLMDAARGSAEAVAKGGDGEGDLFAYISFNNYTANDITPRVLDDYEVTRRVLDDYEVTRRVLDDYGVTRRVLDDYGITKRVLDDYGITQRVLDDYGITKRVLDDYGITQRLLDDYGLTWEEFEQAMSEYDSAIKVRATNDGGISIKIRGSAVSAVLEEMIGDPYIRFLEPDPVASLGGYGNVRNQNGSGDQFVSWGITDITGGTLPESRLRDAHIYVLDSGVLASDLTVATRKDFTMLFVNRDQADHEEDDWVNPGVFDPGTDGNPNDELGHGSHVAGTLAALNNREGVVGAAAGATIHSLKVLTAEGQTDVTTLVAAINYVIDQKQNHHASSDKVLINLSLGMDIGTSTFNVLDETVEKAISAGIVVVVSAGNDGKDASTFSPAHVPGAITVGSYDRRGDFAWFSNHGESVDILAPGEDIVSLPGSQADYDAGVLYLRSGTSMSAPHVTAAAAAMWVLNPSFSPEEVEKALVQESEDRIDHAPRRTTGLAVSMDFAKGNGRVELPSGSDTGTSSDTGFGDDKSKKSKKISIKKAEYKNGEFKLEGKGPKNTTLEIYTESGMLWRTIDTDDRGEYKLRVDASDWPVPCEVTVTDGRNSKTKSVKNAPDGCVV